MVKTEKKRRDATCRARECFWGWANRVAVALGIGRSDNSCDTELAPWICRGS